MVDQPPFLAHADLPAWVESLQVLLDRYAGFTIISGRGGPVTPADVRAQIGLLMSITHQVSSRLAAARTPVEATQELVTGLLDGCDLSGENGEQYHQRLLYGLQQYYNRRLHPQSAVEPSASEEIESAPTPSPNDKLQLYTRSLSSPEA